ncbi:MAG: pyrrolo-quinoline quinone, partial [Planctomycetota bacterium]|nr:pyrrolo-quinoline quinone [Planctomycetota bacterium]
MIWQYDASIRGVNTTPLVIGNNVIGGHSEENIADNRQIGALFSIDATGTGDVTKTKQNWLQMNRLSGRASPVLVGDKLYAVDDAATMFAFNPADGQEVGKKLRLGREIFGSPVYGDGKMYLGEANGIFYIIQPGPDGPTILHKQRLEGENIRGSASISHGRVYFATNSALYCLGTKDAQPSADPIPPQQPETPRTADEKPAQLQLVPIESLLNPARKQKYQARLYNANGRYLKTVPAKLELQGPGKVENDTYTAPAEATHSVATVT